MRIHLKDSTIDLNGIDLTIWRAIYIAASIWQRHGLGELTITSANDGHHKEGSLHYLGRAVDLRTRYLPDSIGMADELRVELGEDYDVILERDHLHIEFDPVT